MMPIIPVTLTFGGALLLGLSFGSGPCNIACLPYLGPVLMASGDRKGFAWRTLLPFSTGRLVGYALLGLVAGAAGLYVQEWIAAPWVRWLLGGATVVAGVAILLRRYTGGMTCSKPDSHPQEGVAVSISGPTKPLLPGSLFLMGMGMALNPCAPLTTVILAAATTASALAGFSLGLGFGIGAIVIPTLVFAFGVAHFTNQIRERLKQWRGALELSSVAFLMFMGVATAMNWMAP